MLTQFIGRNHASISQEEIDNLSDEDYQEYLQWRIQVNLNWMEAEGYVESFVCPDTGEPLYRLASEMPDIE
jgi:hypothetical protein